MSRPRSLTAFTAQQGCPGPGRAARGRQYRAWGCAPSDCWMMFRCLSCDLGHLRASLTAPGPTAPKIVVSPDDGIDANSEKACLCVCVSVCLCVCVAYSLSLSLSLSRARARISSLVSFLILFPGLTCARCGKACASKIELKIHMRKHRDDPPLVPRAESSPKTISPSESQKGIQRSSSDNAVNRPKKVRI
jgi:hypothetical protein